MADDDNKKDFGAPEVVTGAVAGGVAASIAANHYKEEARFNAPGKAHAAGARLNAVQADLQNGTHNAFDAFRAEKKLPGAAKAGEEGRFVNQSFKNAINTSKDAEKVFGHAWAHPGAVFRNTSGKTKVIMGVATLGTAALAALAVHASRGESHVDKLERQRAAAAMRPPELG